MSNVLPGGAIVGPRPGHVKGFPSVRRQSVASTEFQKFVGGSVRGYSLTPGSIRLKVGRRRNQRLREAVSSDEIVTESGNGVGPSSNSKSSGNGVAYGNGQGSYTANVTEPVLVAYNNGSNGNGKASSGNGVYKQVSGNGAAAAPLATAVGVATAIGEQEEIGSVAGTSFTEIEGFMDPCEAGHLDTCAAERVAEREAAAAAAATVGTSGAAATPQPETPYSAPGGRWGKFKKYSVWQRTFEIWSFAVTFFFKLWLTGKKFAYGKKGMTPDRVVERKAQLAAWLREGLVRLGPTFIKIGQQFSTRVDVLSPEFIKELEKLQDNVPPFSSDTAVSIIEQGLGGRVEEIYEEFDRQPIAAASLGQVHLARVEGQRVVVKVQRPGLKELFDIDLKNVRVLAQWLQNVDPKSDGAARDWVAIYDECSRILYQEIDYTLEAQSADRFRTNFASTSWIKVPRVLWQYTTPEVLTMEYAPGVKINRTADLDAMGVDRELLARRTVECYLQQLLTYGFFHADPHPGNIAVDAEGGGRLIYYDFGMMGTIPTDVRSGLLELFYGVYQKDPDRCLDALVAMGVLVPGGDRTAVRRTAEFFLTSFQERLAAQRAEAKANPKYRDSFKPQASAEDKKAKRKQILSNIGEDLLVASADKPFRFPATFTFVVRSFTVLDGIGKGLDPRFDISEIAAPYARELLLEAKPQFAKLQGEVGKRLALQNRAVKNLFRGPNMIEDVANTMERLERGDLKLRVRALEAERALTRVQVMQRLMTSALMASTLVNVGTVLSVSAMSRAATASFIGAGLAGIMVLANWLKVKSMEKREAQLLGA